MISIINPIFDYCTGIPKKDDTSETTVQSLHCLSPYIYDSSQYLAIFYCFFFNKKQWVAGKNSFLEKDWISSYVIEILECLQKEESA